MSTADPGDPTSAAARALAADGLLNARDLGGLPTGDGRTVRRRRVVRSDNLRGLTDAGAVALVREVRPRLVVDLRTEQEVAREGRGLAHLPDLRYVNVALQPKAALTAEQVAAGLATNLYDDYVLQIRDNGPQLLRALRLLAGDDALPALVHCTAGKDRTGLLSALLLELLGVQREHVVADYAASTAGMPAILERIGASAFYRSNGLAGAPAWIFACEPDTMRSFLSYVDERFGGAEAWAVSAALRPEQLSRLRAALLED